MKARNRMAAWLYKNRNKGIPNLMLLIAIGNLIVYLMTVISTQGSLIYDLLYFDAERIFQGQVWRIVTFLFTYLSETNLLLGGLSLLCYYFFGKMLENYWGTLRFNLFYFTGAVIGVVLTLIIQALAQFLNLPLSFVRVSSTFLNLSIFLAVATVQPDAQIRLMFIIPLKMKWVAWVDLGLSAVEIIGGFVWMLTGGLKSGVIYLGWLLPIAALANYFIFFGSQWKDLLPEKWRYRRVRKPRQKQTKANPDWASRYRSADGKAPYRFKCTVCGRTDTSNPGLEFRYCSRCTGYRCYCIDHINNHPHITE